MVKNKKIDINNADLTIDISPDPKSKKRKKKKKPVIVLLFVLIIIGLILIIKFDIGKIGSKYVFPKLENIPVVKYIVPKTNQENLYENYSKDQLINIISGSEIELEESKKKLEEQSKIIYDLEQQIQNLQVFEQEHTKFKEEKKEFDVQAASMNEEAFIKFYENVYPDNAKDIYGQIIKKQQMTKEQKQYADLIAQMDETQAAKALENLFTTDIDIIISILSNMDMESAAAILGQMDAKIAATVIKQLSP